MPLTDEQKKRKNELDRLRRLRIKEEKLSPLGVPKELKLQSEEVNETEEKEITDASVDTQNTEIIVEKPQESEEEKRKKMIADKRRETLALARAKRVNKSVIRDDSKKQLEELEKRKNDEIEMIRKENEDLKNRIINKKINNIHKVEKQNKKLLSKQKEDNSIDYLANQSYAEKLQNKLREQMFNKMLNDTFG